MSGRFVITVEAAGENATRSLARLLKVLLRRYGLRCVSVRRAKVRKVAA